MLKVTRSGRRDVMIERDVKFFHPENFFFCVVEENGCALGVIGGYLLFDVAAHVNVQ